MNTFLRCHANTLHEIRRNAARHFFQEYLESSLRYLHHKFVEDVNDHRTDNIKASTCNLYNIINIMGYTRTDSTRRLSAGFNYCAALLSSH